MAKKALINKATAKPSSRFGSTGAAVAARSFGLSQVRLSAACACATRTCREIPGLTESRAGEGTHHDADPIATC